MIAGSSLPLERKLSKFERVTESGCWVWLGATDKDGYGVIRGSSYGKVWTDKAHRLSYSHFIGPIPKDAHVLHRCDVTCCISPAHLFLGDPAINGLDKKLKGRAKTLPRFGAANPMFGKCGPLNPFFGRKHKFTSIQKMSEAQRARLATK